MVPGKTDPRWKEFVATTKDFGLEGLQTKILLMRVRLMVQQDASRVNEAIDVSHEFFEKNKDVVQADIKKIFG